MTGKNPQNVDGNTQIVYLGIENSGLVIERFWGLTIAAGSLREL